MKPRPALGMGCALAPNGALWVVMLDERGRLVVQDSIDGGVRWTQPRAIDVQGDPISADGENHPKIAFDPVRKGGLVIAYTQPLATRNTGFVRWLRSADGGATFAAPATLHRDRQEITHRFESLAFDARGTLHAVWIDKRDLEAAKAAGQPYAGAALYRAQSSDGGASFGPEALLAAHACECCRIALAPTPDGGMAALWRHVWPVNLRDHAFAKLEGGPVAAPQRATHDGWVVAGCPHHGPAFAPSAAGGWHAVWFGQRDGVAAARLGRLDAQGAATGPVRTLPDAAAEHATLATAGRAVAVAWRSYDGQRMRWRAWLSSDDGATFTLRDLGSTAGESDYARLVSDGRQILALWRTQDEGIRVQRLWGGP